MYIYYINKKGKRLSVIDFKNIYLSIFFLIILVKIETNIIIKLYNLRLINLKLKIIIRNWILKLLVIYIFKILYYLIYNIINRIKEI
jgi:hypothetical protein